MKFAIEALGILVNDLEFYNRSSCQFSIDINNNWLGSTFLWKIDDQLKCQIIVKELCLN